VEKEKLKLVCRHKRIHYKCRKGKLFPTRSIGLIKVKMKKKISPDSVSLEDEQQSGRMSLEKKKKEKRELTAFLLDSVHTFSSWRTMKHVKMQ